MRKAPEVVLVGADPVLDQVAVRLALYPSLTICRLQSSQALKDELHRRFDLAGPRKSEPRRGRSARKGRRSINAVFRPAMPSIVVAMLTRTGRRATIKMVENINRRARNPASVLFLLPKPTQDLVKVAQGLRLGFAFGKRGLAQKAIGLIVEDLSLTARTGAVVDVSEPPSLTTDDDANTSIEIVDCAAHGAILHLGAQLAQLQRTATLRFAPTGEEALELRGRFEWAERSSATNGDVNAFFRFVNLDDAKEEELKRVAWTWGERYAAKERKNDADGSDDDEALRAAGRVRPRLKVSVRLTTESSKATSYYRIENLGDTGILLRSRGDLKTEHPVGSKVTLRMTSRKGSVTVNGRVARIAATGEDGSDHACAIEFLEPGAHIDQVFRIAGAPRSA